MAKNNYKKSQKTNDKLGENMQHNCLEEMFKVVLTERLH